MKKNETDIPDWLAVSPDDDRPESGDLVEAASNRAKDQVNVREMLELAVGGIFSAFLVFLAPFFKMSNDSLTRSNLTESNPAKPSSSVKPE